MNPTPDTPRRVAFITGASVGLGQAIAVALARDGYDLALADLDAGMMKEMAATEKQAGLGIAGFRNPVGPVTAEYLSAVKELRKGSVQEGANRRIP